MWRVVRTVIGPNHLNRCQSTAGGARARESGLDCPMVLRYVGCHGTFPGYLHASGRRAWGPPWRIVLLSVIERAQVPDVYAESQEQVQTSLWKTLR